MAGMVFTASAKIEQEDGWLAPNGTFYATGHEGHHDCIKALLGEKMSVSKAEDAGWCHIFSIIRNWRTELNLTLCQIDTLFDMMMLDPESCLGKNIATWIMSQEEERAEWND